MSFRELTPMLGVADVQRSIDFYCQVLGFQEISRFEPEGRLVWASLTRGAVELMLTRAEASQAPHAGCPAQFYLYCDDVVSLHGAVALAGRRPTRLRVAFYRMKEFEFEDLDGYRYVCGQNTDEPPTPEE